MLMLIKCAGLSLGHQLVVALNHDETYLTYKDIRQLAMWGVLML